MIHLKRFGEAVWFDWPAGQDVRLKIRPLSRKEGLDLISESRRKIGLSIDSEIRIVDDLDQSKFLWRSFCICLEDWEGITLDIEKPTREQMLTAIFNHDGLREFIFEKAKKTAEKEETKFKDELKNFEGSENGSPSKDD